MSNELRFSGDPASDSGLTITAQVFTTGFVQQGTTVSLTEVGSTAGYRGDMPTAAAGEYIVRYFSGGSTLILDEVLFWDGSSPITLGSLKNQVDSLSLAVVGLASDIGSLNDLSAQNIRDALSLSHTDGTRGIDGLIKALTAFAVRRK